MGDQLNSDVSEDVIINPYYKVLIDDFYRREEFWLSKQHLLEWQDDPKKFDSIEWQNYLTKCLEFIELYEYFLAKYRRWNEENGIDNVTGDLKRMQ